MLEDKIAALTAEINLLNKNLTALLGAGLTAPQGTTTAAPAEAEPKTEAKPAEKKPAKPDDQVEEITATDADGDWADDGEDDAPESTAEPELTIDDVRRVVAPLGPVKGRELLAEFGAKRLSDVDPADYSALIKAAKEARS